MGLDAREVADWDVALNAAHHHMNLMPVRDREAPSDDPPPSGVPEMPVGALQNGIPTARRKPGRKPKLDLPSTPEAKRARALDTLVSAAERSNALQKAAAEAGAEHLRRVELADAEVMRILF